jgi:hypothetical protein
MLWLISRRILVEHDIDGIPNTFDEVFWTTPVHLIAESYLKIRPLWREKPGKKYIRKLRTTLTSTLKVEGIKLEGQAG